MIKSDSVKLWEVIKIKTKAMKKEVKILCFLACKRPDVPWYAKLLAAILLKTILNSGLFIL